jgi:hypothetical protein
MTPPYAAYYGSYNALHALNQFGDRFGPVGTVTSRVVGAPLVPIEASEACRGCSD